MHLHLHITPSGSTCQVRTVDCRAQYQAKVRNAGLHLQPEFRLREIEGKRVKHALATIALGRLTHRTLHALDWQPQLPRPDAPPQQHPPTLRTP